MEFKSACSILLSVLLISSLFVILNNNAVAAEPAAAVTETTSSSEEIAAASGSNRFVVWQDGTPGNSDIFFRRSTDNGATWKPIVNMSNNSGDSRNPQVAVLSSNVYVVWNDNTPGNHDILLKRSTDSGATWKAIKNLSTNAGVSISPRIGV